MRVSREKAAANRDRIVEAAGGAVPRQRFRRHRRRRHHEGGRPHPWRLLRPFRLQGRSDRQASRRAMGARRHELGTRGRGGAGRSPMRRCLRHYLTPRHRDDPGQGCAFAALERRRGAQRQERAPGLRRGPAAADRHSRQGAARPLESGAPAQGRRQPWPRWSAR